MAAKCASHLAKLVASTLHPHNMFKALRWGSPQKRYALLSFYSTNARVTQALKKTSSLLVKKSEYVDYEQDMAPRRRNDRYKSEVNKFIMPRVKSRHAQHIPRTRKHSSAKWEPKSSRESNTSTSEALPWHKYRYEIKAELQVTPQDGHIVQVKAPDSKHIPKIAHDLDRVLFSPGVHFLQDPRTRIYNFTPYLKSILPYENFDDSKLPTFVTPSNDEFLLKAATENDKKFYSSTSSMTLVLFQFFLFLNNYTNSKKSVSRFDFPSFSKSTLDLPACVIVEPKGVNEKTKKPLYSVTSDKLTDKEILLSAMGHCLETLLTTSEENFKQFVKADSNSEVSQRKTSETEENTPDSPAENVYNYLSYGDFLMRSQLDCHDPRLPGNGTFDLKTRAVCAIRYDQRSDASKSTYQIWKLKGLKESFEREYEDLIRTGALLKYSFQARIGQMDGIYVAYHNINSFFGFQYIPLTEIDKVFYSHASVEKLLENSDSVDALRLNDQLPSDFAEFQFKTTLDIWLTILNQAIEDLKDTKFAGLPFRLIVKRETRRMTGEERKLYGKSESPFDTSVSSLRVYVVPVSKSQVEELQKFSDKYQTSFREDIPDEQRAANLLKNQDDLDNFNAKALEDTYLLSYEVRATFFDGEKWAAARYHPYPARGIDSCKYKYSVSRAYDRVQKQDASGDKLSGDQLKEEVSNLLQSSTKMLTKAYEEIPPKKGDSKNFRDVLRLYSALGQLRLEDWQSAENPPRVYSVRDTT